jgi:hypothetical protein
MDETYRRFEKNSRKKCRSCCHVKWALCGSGRPNRIRATEHNSTLTSHRAIEIRQQTFLYALSAQFSFKGARSRAARS